MISLSFLSFITNDIINSKINDIIKNEKIQADIEYILIVSLSVLKVLSNTKIIPEFPPIPIIISKYTFHFPSP